MISWLNFEELLIHNPIELINFSKSNIQVALSKKQYIDFFSNKDVYMGLYYNEAMDFCVMFYADPLQSYKSGEMYAEGYIDVDMKIYRVKCLCNVSIRLPFVAPKTITAPMSQGASLLANDAKIYSGKDVVGSVYLDLTNCPCDVRLQFWSEQGMLLGNFVKAGQKGYSRFSGKVPVITGISNIAFYWQKTADPNLTFNYSDFEIKETITALPFKHTAYAYSLNGKDRFSTIYPRLNLLDGTSTFDMNPNSSNNSVSTITKTKVSGITNAVMEVKTSGNAFAVGFYTKKGYEIIKGQTITISFIARGVNDTKVLVGFEGFPSGVKEFRITSDWKLYTYTFTATTSGSPTFSIYGWDMVAGQWFQAYNPKAELGSTATPYMQSKSEVTQSDYPSYIGTYTDYTLEDSTNPSSYTWREIQEDKWNVSKTGMLVSPQAKQITMVQAGALMRCEINNNISGWTDGTTQLEYSGQDFIIDGYGMRGLHNG